MATSKAASTTRKTAKKPVARKQTSKTSSVSSSSRAAAAVVGAKSWFLVPDRRETRIAAVLVAEFIGTFLLAATYLVAQGQPIILMFAIAGLVLLVGTISGAHLNPAVTIGAWVTRRIGSLRAIGYLVAQFLGAGIAFSVIDAFVKGATPVSSQAALYGQTATTIYQATALPATKEWYIFFAELIGGIVLGLVYARILRGVRFGRTAKALTAGFGFFVALMIAGTAATYVGGTAILNPAVALSLGALKWDLMPLVVYILASVVGAAIGFILDDVFRSATSQDK